jgi:diketogulonate reductase-like aldo/keto reductase
MHRVEATGLVTSPVFLLRDTEAPMPTIGFGTWQLDGEDAVSAVTAALEEGYRHFDCAEAYGNEAQVGQALATFLEKQQAEANGVQRKHIFLASKMSNPRPEPHDSGSGESYDSYLRNKVAHQLGLLRTDYLDLYMLHSPLGAHTAEAWAVLESMLAEGTIRAIGVSNFGVGELEQLLKTAKVVPHVVQNKFDIYHRGTQFSTSPENLMGFCRQHQIRLVSYSPLSAYPFVLKPTRDPIAAAAGAAYGVSAARVVLAWIVEQGVAVIPRSTQREHMRENLVAVGQPISHSSSSSADDDFNFKKPLVFTNEMHTSLLPLHVRTSLDWLSDISSTPYTIN